jgi:hypothetical protein
MSNDQGRDKVQGLKSEPRNQKSEGNPKSQARRLRCGAKHRIPDSDFELRASFGFLVSDFGFQACGWASGRFENRCGFINKVAGT